MNLLIKGGHVVDPANNIDGIYDLLVVAGKVAEVARKISGRAGKSIDAQGKIVAPGLIDSHVHLRQPGREDKETIAHATAAAVKGGITCVLAMPNTHPAIDCAESVSLMKRLIQQNALAGVLIAACITKGRQGKELTDIAKLKASHAVAITDDGTSVDDAQLMLEALKKAKANAVLVICHCEDKGLSADGVVNLGIVSTRMGLRGISRESEYKRVGRDILLAEQAKAALHIAHVSCRESVELIARAKKSGARLTCETAPHYFTLTEEDVSNFDTNMKVNPPLRSRDDVAAIKQGLRDGTIDVIATDHAPHTENEKDIEFERAAFGMIGLETALSLGLTELVGKQVLSLSQLVAKMSANPAKILGVAGGALSAGCPADIVIFDPQKDWQVNKEEIRSKSKNSPFIGRRLKGVVEYTLYRGKIVYPFR